MKSRMFGLLLLAIFLPVLVGAQTIVTVPSDFGVGEGSLNNAISAAISGGTLSNTVFQLEPYGLYILTGTVVVPAGQHLTIVGPDPGTDQAHAPAQIVWTSSGGVTRSFIFDCYGDISLKNVWVLYADVGGAQVGSTIQMEDDSAANTSGKGEIGDFEGCIFDYSNCPANAGGSICVTAKHFKGTFKNCYWRNCIDTHLKYYGRAVSFPFGTSGWHNDSLTFENCTFANMGYVLMQEGAEYSDYVKFNHCTFLNSMMFTLESGWWYWLSVTNSVFVNAYMIGDIISARSGSDLPTGGALNVDSVAGFTFTPPFSDADRHIVFAHNSYYIEQWLSDYMDHGNLYSDTASVDYKPHPQPMMHERTLRFFAEDARFPYLSMFNNYDGSNPNFILPPTNQDAIKRYLWMKWTTNIDTNWSYNVTADLQQLWPMDEALNYTNGTLKTAGMGGFPLGDLYHWWGASKYNQWVAQAPTENQTISDWLTNGVSAVMERASVPVEFDLGQNYPNPFNPTTEINYSVPQTGYVSLKVYDVLGSEVETLFAGVQHPGTYYVTFDGSKLASGVYFYKLQAENSSITKKLVLMK